MELSVLDADAPVLMGVGLLNDLEAVIDFGKHPAIWFMRGSGRRHPLLRLPTGHLALRVVPEVPAWD